MSNIYIQEPPTDGKVLLKTTVGDIDVELWSKEAPKACRNFVQLCLENYYDGTIFHRVVKGFIVQGGDPNGDGTGGESIYGHPFKDEFHTRLRFVRRGLVAMANSGKDDNASQFFFTLAATPELQSKNTIFGKVTGNTLYNMLKLEESLVDHDDRPVYPHKIISTEIISNPFLDIIPRVVKKLEEKTTKDKKPKVKKNFKLLSFGEEAEEDEAEIETVNETYKGQSKSSHDLTNDPKLSSVPAVSINEGFTNNNTSESSALDKIRNKLDKGKSDKTQASKSTVESYDMDSEKNDEALNKRKEIRNQIKALKKELKGAKKSEEQQIETIEPIEEEPVKEENSVLLHYHKQLEKYDNQSKAISRKGTSEREEQTLKILEKFKNTLHSAKETVIEKDEEDSENEDDNDDWLVHCLRTNDEKVVVAKDANMPSADRYDLSDPRNPLNERRRKKEKKRK